MNSMEKEFKKGLEKDGWEVGRSGWPDFIAYRNGEVRLIELKSACDKVRPNQTKMHKLLAKCFSLKVEIVKPLVKDERNMVKQMLKMLRHG